MFQFAVKTPRKAGIKAGRPTLFFSGDTLVHPNIMMQEKLIGESYYSLADFGRLNFDINGLRRKKCAVSIFTWRHSVEPFEISDKVTFISETNASDDLFHAEKCSREKRCRLLHAQ